VDGRRARRRRGAVLSHRSAAALWGIRDTSRSGTDVTVPRQRRPRPQIQLHHAALQADEVTVHDGIPVTNPARTLLDLAEVLSAHQLERAINEAEFRRLTSPLPLDALVARHPNRRGTRALKRILEATTVGDNRTRTDLESAFLAFLDAHDLPRPKTNRTVGPGEVDAVWPDRRLVAELDGYDAHTTRRAFENDRARDRELVVAGWRLVRITWRQLEHDPERLATQPRALLGDTVQAP
jgi:very-short-patch-repair endonuclease